MENEEKTMAELNETNIQDALLISREQSVKKCFAKSWKLFTDDGFLASKKLKAVRAGAALLLGVATTFAMKWAATCALNLQAIKLFMPEELTWKDKFQMIQSADLWLCLGFLLAGCIIAFWHRSIKQKMLACRIEASEPQGFTQGFGKKVQLALVLTVCWLIVGFVVCLPIVFLFLSHYQSAAAVAIGDPVADSLTILYSSALLCTALIYLLLSFNGLGSIAWKVIDTSR